MGTKPESGHSPYGEKKVEGCLTARIWGRYWVPRWINRKVEKMAQ